MSGMLSGRAIFGNQPNVLFDASNYSKGQADALAIQKNRLMMDRAQMENTADQAFRAAAPGAIGGDPAALNAAIAADPERGMTLQSQLAGLDAGRRKKMLESVTTFGQSAAALLNLSDDEMNRQYPIVLDDLSKRGFDVSALPPTSPGRAVIETFARRLMPVADQLKAQDERIVPAGDMSQPRGLRNNNPLNIEAGQFTQSMPGFKGSDGRFAVFESPEQGIAAADALLMRYGMQGRNTPAKIIEKWAPAGDGNNVSAYAGSVAKALGIGPNDPIPMEDPAARRALIDAMSAVENGKRGPQPLVRQGNGMPVVQGAQPGMQWAMGPNGQRVQMPIPGAGERIKPPEGFRYSADGTQFEAIPGGPADPKYKGDVKAAEQGANQISASDRTKLRTAETEASAIVSSLDEFLSRRAAAGFGERATSAVGVPTPLNTAFNSAALMAKGEALFNLGVLNGPDLDIIRRTLADPGTIRGAAASQETVTEQVGIIKRLIQTRLDAARQNFGGASPTANGQPTPAPQASAGPAPGAVEDGYRFKGGNPGDPASWERVN